MVQFLLVSHLTMNMIKLYIIAASALTFYVVSQYVSPFFLEKENWCGKRIGDDRLRCCLSKFINPDFVYDTL